MINLSWAPIIWPWDYHFTPQQRWEFWKLGDVNLDGCIDSADLQTIINNYGLFNPNCDINDDGVIDQADLDIAQANFGLDIWDYFGVPHPTSIWIVAGIIGLAGFMIGGIVWASRKKEKK